MAEMKSGSTAEGPYLLGMDIGTGSVRVGIFDRKGTPVVFEGVELETRHPRPGRAEQDPETWWSGLAMATRRALEEGDFSPGEILGIGVDATASTLLAVDEQGGPLLPAIMWMDDR
jgi:sugar (pentulose or hexulose) kinase